jgi:hypothetical protein
MRRSCRFGTAGALERRQHTVRIDGVLESAQEGGARFSRQIGRIMARMGNVRTDPATQSRFSGR